MIDLTSYENKTVLVTGASGYIASNLIEKLSQLKCRIIPVSRKVIPNAAAKYCQSSFWRDTLNNVDVIFHLAAQTSIKLANEHPQQDLQTNILPLIAILDACAQQPQKPHLVLASTVSIYGLTEKLPVDERQEDNPLTTYCLHKQVAEHYLTYYIKQNKVSGCALRLANVYGPGAKASSPDRNILNKMIVAALQGQALTVYGEGDFIRDYVFIDDIANAFLAAGITNEKTNGKSFIISSGTATPFIKAIQLIADEVHRQTQQIVDIHKIPLPSNTHPIDLRNFQGNSQAFTKATGWQATTSLLQGIKNTVHHYAQQREHVPL